MSTGSGKKESSPDDGRPYSGIVESAIAKLSVSKEDPKGDLKRSLIHWAVIVSAIVFVLGMVGIVGLMISGLMRG